MQTDGAAGHGVAGFFNNAHTAVTRRIKNIMTDERTHSIFERFLGLPISGSAVAAAAPPAPGERSAALAAAAQELPLCDDGDSADEEDVLAGRRWPPHSQRSQHSPLDGSSVPASPGTDGGPTSAGSAPLPPPLVEADGGAAAESAPRPSVGADASVDLLGGALESDAAAVAPPALAASASVAALALGGDFDPLRASGDAEPAGVVPSARGGGAARFDGFDSNSAGQGEDLWSDDKLEPVSLI